MQAQTAQRTDEVRQGGCEGVLCSLTPASMDRPVLAEEAKRLEADRASHAVVDTPPDNDRRLRASRRVRHAASGHAGHHHAFDGRSVAAKAMPIARYRGEVAPTGPINAIFVLAPCPFDPYGGDYAPWLERLAWPNQSDRAGDRTVFSADGYREADSVPAPEPVSRAVEATDDLARRSNALSRRGFQALKTDLGGS